MAEETTALATRAAEPLLAILDKAMNSGHDAATLEKFFGLYEKMQAHEAKRAWAEAMAAFKRDCPPIVRRTENTQFRVTRNGTQANRTYASLEDIQAAIREPLARHGLSFRWSGMVVRDGQMHLSCIVSHIGGHHEESPVQIPWESRAGCSEQQKFGSAMTYAQRYSLIQALGLTSCDADDDGNATMDTATIAPEQMMDLAKQLEETKSDQAKFVAFFGVASLKDLPAAAYPKAVAMLEAKRRAAK